jgi:hypothetical protein
MSQKEYANHPADLIVKVMDSPHSLAPTALISVPHACIHGPTFPFGTCCNTSERPTISSQIKHLLRSLPFSKTCQVPSEVSPLSVGSARN